MTETIFKVVTRAVALGCVLTAVGYLLGLPIDVLGVLHHVRRVRMLTEENGSAYLFTEEHYWIRYYALYALSRLLTGGIALGLAMWLMRGGRGTRRFFGLIAELKATTEGMDTL